MIFSFNYLIFQANCDKDRVSYWKDGNPTKETIKMTDFLDLAMNINDGLNYSKIHDACHTYSFYLWDTLDQKVIPLVLKVNKEDYHNYENNLSRELGRLKANKAYHTMRKDEQVALPKDELSRLFMSYGFENPRLDIVPLLNQSLEANLSSDTFLGRLKSLFKK